MIAWTVMAVALAAQSTPQLRLAHAVDLYETACLRTFPDDAALDALMKNRGARPLGADDVKVTLRDDPGRAWQIGTGADRLLVFLELPPFHACSVRFTMPEALYDLSGYREVEHRYADLDGGFADVTPLDGDQDDLHLHLVGKQRKIAAGTESLMIVDQYVTDIARRSAGETGISVRFVRQIKAD